MTVKNTVRALIALATSLLVTGCAIEATPIPFSQASAVPADRTFLYQKPEGDATIPVLVKRDVGIPSVACSANLLVNGKLAATLETGEKVTLFLPSGRAFLAVQPRSCGHYLSEVEATIASDAANKFRITASSRGDMSIQATGTD